MNDEQIEEQVAQALEVLGIPAIAAPLQHAEDEPMPDEPTLPTFQQLSTSDCQQVIDNTLRNVELEVLSSYLLMIANRSAGEKTIRTLRYDLAVKIRALQYLYEHVGVLKQQSAIDQALNDLANKQAKWMN